MNKEIKIVFALLVSVSIVVCCVHISDEPLKFISGVACTKKDTFRIQVSNDPFFEDIILNMENLSYCKLLDYGFIDKNNEFNMNLKFWEDVLKHKGVWDDLDWHGTGEYKITGKWTIIGGLERREIIKSTFHTRVQVWKDGNWYT